VYAVVWAVSSGGERLVDTEEVTGSNPVSPTILKARVSPSSKALRVSGGFLLFGELTKRSVISFNILYMTILGRW
jgi:hypothetical protein